MKLDDQVYLLGIRHHGPGCAFALQSALAHIQPDLILLEGAQELESCWQLAGDPAIRLPVAQLVYDPSNPSLASFYPWAEFSPEWQAMQYALAQHIELRMMDLPAGIEFERQAQAQNVAASEESASEGDLEAIAPVVEPIDTDEALDAPLDRVVQAAGFADAELWWDMTIEHQRSDLGVFEAIASLMQAAREQASVCSRDQRREAWMRKMLRDARKQFKTIAVVCGAWHVPALAANIKAKEDNALLKGLKKRKVEVAWVPYTYQRFSMQSGYRAGVASPGWYEHVYQHHTQLSAHEDVLIHWMIKIAHLLRGEGFACSSAHVIEAVRLAQDLAALRQLPMATLAETLESAQAVMTEGKAAPLRVIREKLIISDRLGQLPENIPLLPIEQDLNAQIKTLRLKKQVEWQDVELDLRKEAGLQRSHLFHRLDVLSIRWASLEDQRGLGTFKERWALRWQPEFSVALIDASTLGNTIEGAAEAFMQQEIAQINSVSDLSGALDQILLCHLPAVLPAAIGRLKSLAAVSGDLQDLMQSMLSLVQVSRYGSVRAISTEGLLDIIDSIVIRVTNGLASACVSLDEAAAYLMLDALDKAHSALSMLENNDYNQRWLQALLELIDHPAAHAVLHGRATRILYDLDYLSSGELEQHFYLHVSQGNDDLQAAAWIEGVFIQGATLLLYDKTLFELVDTWLNRLEEESFIRVLPLIRRAFSTFSASELQQLGDKVCFGDGQSSQSAYEYDGALATSALTQLATLMGFRT